MFNKFVLPVLAVAGACYAVYTVVEAQKTPPPVPPLLAPPVRPKFRAIAGAGLIEARMENIPIGTVVPGVVTRVFVKVDEAVEAGAPLFQIDDRAVRAEVKVQQALLASAEAQLAKLRSAPRPEDLRVAAAAEAEAEARYQEADVQQKRAARLIQQNSLTKSEYDTTFYAQQAAAATLNKARAELDKLPTWEQDLRVAEAAVEEARARLDSAQIELERLTVRAPTAGQVLQVNVRPGQFAALAWQEPLVVLGDITRLHVRVDIDEQDVPLFDKHSEAIATLKGRPQVQFALKPYKVEPYVIPKRSLTGENSERVDTRVLQVIYALPEERPIPLYVGQQMDVYIKAAPERDDLKLDADPGAPKPFDDEPPASPVASPGAAVPTS